MGDHVKIFSFFPFKNFTFSLRKKKEKVFIKLWEGEQKNITENKLFFIIPNVQINSLLMFILLDVFVPLLSRCSLFSNVAYSELYGIVPINVHSASSHAILRHQITLTECSQ